KKGGYIVKVCDSTLHEGRRMALIVGDTAVETIYAAADFADDYKALACRTDRVPYFDVFMTETTIQMPDYYVNTAPTVKRRGIWTWGHCIYDYKKFFENMARIKLNRITIWNDFVPANMADIIDYAHSLGIAVVLGFSWGWRVQIDLSEPDKLNEWMDSVINNYENNYAHLNHDGIYFQTFTETNSDNINGMSIAENAVIWTNTISGRLLEKYPNLEIQFGLHATSVKDHLETIAKVDPRVSIVWEDCGDFPWHYCGYIDEDQKATEDFTRAISNLRKYAPFGGVLKGHICLDWGDFEHQTGPFIMGENPLKMRNRRDYAARLLRQSQSFWLKNAGKVLNIIRIMGENADISDLVEDGMFEEKIWFSVALYAQMLWESDKDSNYLIAKVAERENITFA
ncbi:MAG: hypothetical protein WCX81_05170, partial [Monoglobales bacterium]